MGGKRAIMEQDDGPFAGGLFEKEKVRPAKREEYSDLRTLKRRERALGAVATPKEIVSFMIEQAAPHKTQPCKVLEPACGNAPFLTAFAERYGPHHEFLGIEIDPETAQRTRHHFSAGAILAGDFLLWQPDKKFDIVIGNPPYGIIGDASHYPIYKLKERKEAYRARFSTWRGKFNIYGAFMEHATQLLAPDGRLIFVVPASWLVLDDFILLRKYFALMGKLRVYYLGKAFPKRSVSVVVVVLERGQQGLELYEGTRKVVDKPVYHGEIIRFETPAMVAFEQGGIPLSHYFSVHFAARSPEIRRHPAVVFEPQPHCVPVLTGRNLHAGWIDYESCYSGLWMPKERAGELRSFYRFPHLVVAHTKGSQVVAAVDERCYPWREEFHLVPKVKEIDLWAVERYLNSERVQEYVATLYRDFVPHLTATMLKRIPLPPTMVSP